MYFNQYRKMLNFSKRLPSSQSFRLLKRHANNPLFFFINLNSHYKCGSFFALGKETLIIFFSHTGEGGICVRR